MGIYRKEEDGSWEEAYKDNVEIPFREQEEWKEEEKRMANSD